MYEKRIAPKGAVRRFVPIWLNQGQNIFVAIDHQLAMPAFVVLVDPDQGYVLICVVSSIGLTGENALLSDSLVTVSNDWSTPEPNENVGVRI